MNCAKRRLQIVGNHTGKLGKLHVATPQAGIGLLKLLGNLPRAPFSLLKSRYVKKQTLQSRHNTFGITQWRQKTLNILAIFLFR